MGMSDVIIKKPGKGLVEVLMIRRPGRIMGGQKSGVCFEGRSRCG